MVVEPVTLEGPRLCVPHAKQVFVISNTLAPEPGLDVRSATRRLPLRDASVEVVMFFSPALTLAGPSCAIQLADAARVLSPGGFVGIALGDSLTGHDLEHIRKCLGEPFRELRVAVVDSEPVLLLGSWSATISGIHNDPSVRPLEALNSDSDRAVSANLGRELHPADVLVDRQRLRQELARRTASLRIAEAKQSEAEEELRRERLENVRLVAEIERMREERDRNRVFEQQRAHKLEQLGTELSQLERAHAELKAASVVTGNKSVSTPSSAEVERALASERSALAQAKRSEQALAQLTYQLKQARRAHDEKASQVAKLRAELDVVKIEFETSREQSQDQQALLAKREQAVAAEATKVQALRRQLELLAGEYQHARHRLEQRGLRIAELEVKLSDNSTQPEDAQEWTPVRRFALESRVRAEEQEYLLIQLDKAEQRIWEMVDASDRSAARLAAGLAQLEKQKEQYDELLDELEINRGSLAAARTRVNDLERILSVEHTKLARAGIEVESVPAAQTSVVAVATVGDVILDALVDDDEDGVVALAEPRPEDTPNYAEVASHVVSRDARSDLEHYELDSELLNILDVDSGMYKVGSPGLGELLREHDEAPRVEVQLSADLEKALDLLDEDESGLPGL